MAGMAVILARRGRMCGTRYTAGQNEGHKRRDRTNDLFFRRGWPRGRNR